MDSTPAALSYSGSTPQSCRMSLSSDVCEFRSDPTPRSYRSKLLLDDLRGRVRELKTSRAELKAWWGGLSAKIASLHEAVDELHGEIIVRILKFVPCHPFLTRLLSHTGGRLQRPASVGCRRLRKRVSSAFGCTQPRSVLMWLQHHYY